MRCRSSGPDDDDDVMMMKYDDASGVNVGWVLVEEGAFWAGRQAQVVGWKNTLVRQWTVEDKLFSPILLSLFILWGISSKLVPNKQEMMVISCLELQYHNKHRLEV